MNFIIQSECVCSSVDRAMPSGGMCGGSTPLRRYRIKKVLLFQRIQMADNNRIFSYSFLFTICKDVIFHFRIKPVVS